jgi:NADH-quinone oxidoreductase subunit F
MTADSFSPILMKNFGASNLKSFEVYRSLGGYETLKRALKSSPDDIVEQVKKSGLRGRGGAGFPTGLKWTFLPKDRTETILCINGDEAEPGTYCNRVLVENDPHQVLEGVIISAFAIRSNLAYFYLRDEYPELYHILEHALAEAYQNNLLGENILGSGYSLRIHLFQNSGAYICGEETGLLESIEGKRPWPRIKPPFPAVRGLFGRPTIINNIETLANVVHIVDRGAEWYKSIGTELSPGSKMFCVSGHVNRPGCFEFPMGVNLKQVIDAAGGVRSGNKIKAVIPGGISTGFLTADEIDVPLAFENFSRAINGCLGLGSGAIVVLDEMTDMLNVLHNVARFFSHESCGQCTQCREGTGWAYKITSRMLAGRGRKDDLGIIEELSENMGMMSGNSICGLSDGAAYPLRTLIQKFRGELEEGIKRRYGQADKIDHPYFETQLKATYVRQ